MLFAGQHRRVLAPDYHGYGESSPPANGAQVSIADYARTIWQAMDQLGIEVIDVLGHHTGSKVATEMIAQRPSAVCGVVFISASLRTEAELKGAPPLFEPIAPDSEGSRMLSFLRAAEEYRGDGAGLDFCYEFVADCMRAGGRYQEGNRAAFRYNQIFPDRLRNISQRVHVLNPEDDLYAITPRVLEHLSDRELITLPGWGLGMLHAHAEETAEVVSQLLNRGSETSLETSVREDLG